MRKSLAAMALLVGCIPCTQAADLAAAAAQNLVIQFDGYCDGLAVTTNSATGLISGNRTGCISGLAHGSFGSVAALGGGRGATLRDVNGTEFASLDFITVLNAANNTWAYYFADGSVLNSGTFTLVSVEAAAAAQRGAAFPSTRAK